MRWYYALPPPSGNMTKFGMHTFKMMKCAGFKDGFIWAIPTLTNLKQMHFTLIIQYSTKNLSTQICYLNNCPEIFRTAWKIKFVIGIYVILLHFDVKQFILLKFIIRYMLPDIGQIVNILNFVILIYLCHCHKYFCSLRNTKRPLQ